MRVRLIVRSIAPRTAARYFLLAVAIACLGFYGYVSVERALYQESDSRAFDLSLVRGAAAVAPSSAGTTPASRQSRPVARISSQAAIVGRLSIPRLHLSAMVREGVDSNTLQIAVGHIPATPLPGESGNVAVAGHRDSFFRGLKDLRAEDEIRFSTRNGDFKYAVQSLTIVEPNNVDVLAPSPENVLTLVTCYPFSYIGAAPRRFVVRARQLSTQTATQVIVE